MKIHLSGHLNWYEGEKRAWLDLKIDRAIPLAALVEDLGIPPGEIVVMLVNGQQSHLSAMVGEGDVVELFPPASGG